MHLSNGCELQPLSTHACTLSCSLANLRMFSAVFISLCWTNLPLFIDSFLSKILCCVIRETTERVSRTPLHHFPFIYCSMSLPLTQKFLWRVNTTSADSPFVFPDLFQSDFNSYPSAEMFSKENVPHTMKLDVQPPCPYLIWFIINGQHPNFFCSLITLVL